MKTKNQNAEHLSELDGLAMNYSKSREKLGEIQTNYEAEVRAIQRRYRISIRNQLIKAVNIQQELKGCIEKHKATFEKPRTRTMHGIKIGYRKQKGKMKWDNPDKVVGRIEKLFPQKADLLIDTKKVPSKQALELLDAKDLKKLGVSVVADTDEVVIKDAATELDKLIEQLLETQEEES